MSLVILFQRQSMRVSIFQTFSWRLAIYVHFTQTRRSPPNSETPIKWMAGLGPLLRDIIQLKVFKMTLKPECFAVLAGSIQCSIIQLMKEVDSAQSQNNLEVV